MDDELQLSRQLKAVALFPDEEEGLRSVAKRAERRRRTRTIARAVLAACAVALVATGAFALRELVRPHPVLVITDTPSVTTPSAAGSSTTSSAAPVLHVQTTIAGDPSALPSPPEELILQLSAGSSLNEFGMSLSGGPMEIEFAVSDDLETIGLNDRGNSRVLLYSLEGEFKGSFNSPRDLNGASMYGKMLFDAAGHLVICTSSAPEMAVIVNLEGNVLERISWPAHAEDFHIDRLVRAGDDVWAVGGATTPAGDMEVSYPLILDGAVPSPQASQTLMKSLPVTGDATFGGTRISESEFEALITPFAGNPLVWRIGSQLPISSGRAFGADAQGNYYALLRLDAGPTGSLCVLGITPTGSPLGQVTWPFTYRYGGGHILGPDGAVYDCRTTADGIELVRYRLSVPAPRPDAATLVVSRVDGLTIPGIERVVGQSWNSLWVAGPDGTRVSTLPSDLRFTCASQSANGDRAVFAAEGAQQLTFWRADAPNEGTVVGASGAGAYLSPQGDRVIVRSETYGSGLSFLHLVDLASGRSERLRWPNLLDAGRTWVTNVLWGDDSQAFFFSIGDPGGDLGGHVLRYDLASGSFRELAGMAEIYALAPSGDVLGTQIADPIPATNLPIGLDAASRPLAVWADSSVQVLPHAPDVQGWSGGVFSKDGDLAAVDSWLYENDSRVHAFELYTRVRGAWQLLALVPVRGITSARALAFAPDGTSLWFEKGTSASSWLCRLDLGPLTESLAIELPLSEGGAHSVQSLVFARADGRAADGF